MYHVCSQVSYVLEWSNIFTIFIQIRVFSTELLAVPEVSFCLQKLGSYTYQSVDFLSVVTALFHISWKQAYMFFRVPSSRSKDNAVSQLSITFLFLFSSVNPKWYDLLTYSDEKFSFTWIFFHISLRIPRKFLLNTTRYM